MKLLLLVYIALVAVVSTVYAVRLVYALIFWEEPGEDEVQPVDPYCVGLVS
jgi:hypothetical protein